MNSGDTILNSSDRDSRKIPSPKGELSMVSPEFFPFRKYERLPFDGARCIQCGKCLSECPVLRLPEARAKQGIVALAQCFAEIAAPNASRRWLPTVQPPTTAAILRKCSSCFACNLVCPNDCRPANLILDIWYRQYKKEGLPVRARYFLPHSVPNFRTYVIERLSGEEKAALDKWKRARELRGRQRRRGGACPVRWRCDRPVPSVGSVRGIVLKRRSESPCR